MVRLAVQALRARFRPRRDISDALQPPAYDLTKLLEAKKTDAKILGMAKTMDSRHQIKEAEAMTSLGIQAQQALVDTQIKVASTTAQANAKKIAEKK